MEQKCCKCNLVKDLNEFQGASRNPLGKMYTCRDCIRILYRDRRLRNIESHKKKDRNYYQRHKDEIRKKRSKYASKNKDRISARSKVIYAVYSGKIIRPKKCSECGVKCTPDAHHEDYTKPLDVVWYCRKCHQIKHNGK